MNIDFAEQQKTNIEKPKEKSNGHRIDRDKRIIRSKNKEIFHIYRYFHQFLLSWS